MTKLKPVTFVQGKYRHNAQNTTQQILLLKALKVTQDPKKLKEMIGVRTVAEVFRTLDKMAMRKEYHKALSERGISFEYLIDKTKEVIEGAEKDSDKLNAIKMLIKSVGMDKYEETAIGGGSWEDILVNAVEKRKAGGMESPKVSTAVYEVKPPVMPENVRKIKEAEANEKAEGKSLYD